jgi:putative colanic acid biosynthesis glycosyltransferase
MTMAPPSPLFSVITVCRDHAEGLIRTHASLAAQARRDFEWLVQDGGSGDGTAALLRHLRDPAALSVSAPDDGLYDAMNRAMARANGAYLLFLNAGDELAGPEVLAEIAARLAHGPADFIYGDSWEEAGGRPVRKRARSHRLLWYGMNTHHQAMLYRRVALGGLCFRTDLSVGADYAFTLEAVGRARRCLSVPIAICRFESGGVSQRRTAQGRRDQMAARRGAGFPPLANRAVAVTQVVALAIRRALPGLYRRLRYR